MGVGVLNNSEAYLDLKAKKMRTQGRFYEKSKYD